MTRKVAIELNVGNALTWLGQLYRNQADALKEHVSNAIDEHRKARASGRALTTCDVRIMLERNSITVEYPYGMDEAEFKSALKRVADSAKKDLNVRQIGQLGIGIFSYQQIGKKCVFYSKKTDSGKTVKVVLRKGSDEAEFESPAKREELSKSGIKIVISELASDPTKARGPLSVEKIGKLWSEQFYGYLREGWLRITLECGGQKIDVKPLPLGLPRLLEDLESVYAQGKPSKCIRLELYFDASGNGSVAIRHAGVVVVASIAKLEALGLEETLLGEGFVKGYIDADFLQPLPARTGFEENDDWLNFLVTLDSQVLPDLNREVDEHRARQRQKEHSELAKRAIETAIKILSQERFNYLVFLGGMRKKATRLNGSQRKRATVTPTVKQPKDAGTKLDRTGARINYEEIPFDEGPDKHSRFRGGKVQANELNSDFRRAMQDSYDDQLNYVTLLIGKETIASNEGSADDHLEDFLSFYYGVKEAVKSTTRSNGRRKGGTKRLA